MFENSKIVSKDDIECLSIFFNAAYDKVKDSIIKRYNF